MIEKTHKTLIQQCDQQFKGMQDERSHWEHDWKKLRDNFYPRKGRFLASDRNKNNHQNKLINNTSLTATRTLKSGLMTGITSPARPWFRLSPADTMMIEYGPVREWLSHVERLIYRIFSQSNLYQQLPNIYGECGVFGTAALLCDENIDNIAHFTAFTIGEYYLDVDQDGYIGTFGREYEYSLRQAQQKFGYDNLSYSSRTLIDNGQYDSKITIRHLIVHKDEYDMSDHKQKNINDDFNWYSLYYETGGQNLRETSEKDKFLKVSGYRDFPVMCPRWDAISGDIYGYSAAMDAIGDAISLQVQEKFKSKAIAKMVDPPTQSSANVKSGKMSVLPGHHTYVTQGQEASIKPIYQVNPQVRDLKEDILQVQQRIEDAMYVSLFERISNDDKVRTASEIAAREDEKLLQLGPVLESLHNELLDPLIDRVFSIVMTESQRGWEGLAPLLLPPPPRELLETELKIEYISVLAQAQKLVSTSATERFVGFGTQLATVDPNAMDMIDTDGVMEEMADSLGVGSKAIRDKNQVEQMRQSRMEQQQQQQDQQLLGAGAEFASKLGGIDTQSKNALTDLMGGAV